MGKDQDAIIRGKRLKKLREKKNLTQKDLAVKSGISQKLIQHYEQGEKDTKNMTIETLYQLSRGLDIPMERLAVLMFSKIKM